MSRSCAVKSVSRLELWARRASGRGSRQKFQLLPEKGVHTAARAAALWAGGTVSSIPLSSSSASRAETACTLELHPVRGQLLGGQRSRKAHPKHPVPVGDGLQNGRRKGEIVGVLGQERAEKSASRQRAGPAAR